MSFSRFVATMKIVLFGHIFNWPWRSRVKRRAVRSDVISKVIPTYFKRYLPAAAAIKEREVQIAFAVFTADVFTLVHTGDERHVRRGQTGDLTKLADTSADFLQFFADVAAEIIHADTPHKLRIKRENPRLALRRG